MRITTFSDYALRVLMYLAVQGEGRVTIDEVATAYDISPHHLTKVVHLLGRSGWVDTARGKGGGLRLGQDPETIRLGEVLRACEGTGPMVECLGDEPGLCRISSVCRLSFLLGRAFEAFYGELNRHTLADLVRRPEALREALQLSNA